MTLQIHAKHLYQYPLLMILTYSLLVKKLHELKSNINDELCKISAWLKVNKLSLDIKKTHYMIFTTKKSYICTISLNIDGHPITEVSKTKFLGVIIDNKLKCNEHITYTGHKISRGIGMIIKAQKVPSSSALIVLYYSLIYPIVIYRNHVWGSTYEGRLDNLHLLYKKILRIIAGVKPRELTDPLYKQYGILKLKDINKYMIGHFMYKYHTDQLPRVFHDYFTLISDVHNHDTRQKGGLFVSPARVDLVKMSLSFRCPLIWNTILKLDINPLTSEASFCKMLKLGIQVGLNSCHMQKEVMHYRKIHYYLIVLLILFFLSISSVWLVSIITLYDVYSCVTINMYTYV